MESDPFATLKKWQFAIDENPVFVTVGADNEREQPI
jgi:hypothetical protein